MSGERSVNILTRIHEAIVSCKENNLEIESIELNTSAMLAFKEAVGKKIIEGLLPWDVYAPFNDNKKMLFLGIEIKEVVSNINGITVIYKE